jgi:transcriptional regulator with XRE-family HTH domain
MAEPRALGFGGLLRQLRAEAGLTQEELAGAAGLSPRSVSDLERGVNRAARKDTAELLAGALGLAEAARALFVAAARGRAPAEEVLAALREAAASGGPAPGGPYLGLVPFEERDARLFYGRGELADRCWPPPARTGASGCGIWTASCWPAPTRTAPYGCGQCRFSPTRMQHCVPMSGHRQGRIGCITPRVSRNPASADDTATTGGRAYDLAPTMAPRPGARNSNRPLDLQELGGAEGI